ncbi:MAG: hypothetical protein GF310_04185 [candidate division Zixibacteria bacterium]|nr:hypothetical protein [candidate division Zixibacteria bacterium]
MKKILYRIGMIVFILGGAALLVGLHYYDLLRVEKAVCKPGQSEMPISVDEYVQDYVGNSILDYPLKAYVDTMFAQYPQISRASVKCDPTGKIKFDYDLKEPIALINLDIVYGLTVRGELVPAGDEDMPIITGLRIQNPELYKQLDGSKIGYALKIANLINKDTTGIGDAVSSINLGHPSGLSVYIEDCRSEFVLGYGDESDKLDRLADYCEFFCALDDDIRSVDFRFDNQLIMRKY